MSSGLNKVTLIGNLGAEPELRETHGAKKSVCNFRIATNESRGRGEFRKERTEWHAIVVWGRLAELCAEHLQTGSKVYIEGHIQTRKWQDKDSNQRITTEVVAENIIFLDSRNCELLAENLELHGACSSIEKLLGESMEKELGVEEVALGIVELIGGHIENAVEVFKREFEQSAEGARDGK